MPVWTSSLKPKQLLKLLEVVILVQQEELPG